MVVDHGISGRQLPIRPGLQRYWFPTGGAPRLQSSLAFFKEKITSIPDELTRAMIWQSLYNMVKDGKLSGYQFVQASKDAIEKEKSDTCLSSVFTYTSASLNFVPDILKNNYLKPQLFEATLRSLQNFGLGTAAIIRAPASHSQCLHFCDAR